MAKRGGIISDTFWWHICRQGTYCASDKPDCEYCTATRKQIEDDEKAEKKGSGEAQLDVQLSPKQKVGGSNPLTAVY